MSTQSTIICDRCGDVCLNGHSRVTVSAGLLILSDVRQVDLCPTCGAGLLDYIRSGRPELAAANA